MIDKFKFFSKKFSLTADEVEWCKYYCNTWWKESVENILRIANEVVNKEFIFDLPWDMERTVEIVKYDQKIRWDYMPKNDPEFIYQMNRHRYWICLGQAYSITGEEKYAIAFAEQLESWIRNNPITEETKQTTWRTIDAGIRGENWVKAMGYFINSSSITTKIKSMFFKSLITHGDYLFQCTVPFSDKSNWGILESRGLYFIGKALGEDTKGKLFSKTAIDRLEKQLKIQILDDGVHWEQSPMYHNEVLKCCLEVIRVAEKFGEQVSQVIYEKAKAMAYANLVWKKPNNHQVATGDSDETDLRDVLSISGYQFKDGHLKYVGYKRLDFEAVWDYGREATIEYEKLVAIEPKDKFYFLKDSGNCYLKSGWKENDDFFHFRCGSLGGGHGHYDKLHIDLSICGEDVLIDPGRYTYVDSKLRRDLKSTYFHNTVRVDCKEYTQCLDSWGGAPITVLINQNAYTKEKYTYVEGGHLGYLKDNIVVNRKVIAIGTKIYVVVDEFYGTGNHKYEQLYHFNPKSEINVKDNKIKFIGKRAKVGFYTISVGAETVKKESIISKHYNEKEKNEKVIVSTEGEAFSSIVTVIIGQDIDDNNEYSVEKVDVSVPVTQCKLSDSEAEGVYIKGDEEEYLVIVNHLETGCNYEYIGALGVNGLGSVIVCDMKEKDKKMTILKW